MIKKKLSVKDGIGKYPVMVLNLDKLKLPAALQLHFLVLLL